MHEIDLDDPSQQLPWSPHFKEQESKTHNDTPHPRKSKFSPRFRQGDSITLTPISEGAESDETPTTPVFHPDRLPWSPQFRPPLAIAYIFGNHRHPLVEKIIPILELKHDIKLIFSVSEQPPKPFPLFYLCKGGDNFSKVLEVGNNCSDGHCILIFPDDKKLPANFAEIECKKLQISCDKEEYELKEVENLCQQMSDCTEEVYAKTPSPHEGF